MNKPRLKDAPLSASLTAHQVDRAVEIIVSPARDAMGLVELTVFERIALDNFTARLADAWREYDRAVGN